VARTNPIWVPVAAIRHSSPQAGAPGGEATTLAVADRPQAAEPAEGIKQALRAMPSSTKSPRQSRQPATTLTSTPRERPPWSSYRKPHRGWPDRPRRPARLTAGGPGDVAVAAEQAGAVHRLDRRHWHRRWAPGHDRPLAQLPYGAVTDLTVENRAGHRTLDASTPQWPSPRRVYRLQESTSPPAAPRGAGSSWTVRTGPLQFSFTIGRRGLLGWRWWATGQPPRARHNPEPPIVRGPQICGADMTLDASAEICPLVGLRDRC